MPALVAYKKISILSTSSLSVTNDVGTAYLFKINNYSYDGYRNDFTYVNREFTLQHDTVQTTKIKESLILGEVTVSINRGGKFEAAFTLLDSKGAFSHVMDVQSFFSKVVGTRVQIEAGYVGRSSTLIFDGYIQGFNTNFPESGRPDITFRCLGLPALVNNEAFTFAYPYIDQPGTNSFLSQTIDFLTGVVANVVIGEGGVFQVQQQQNQDSLRAFLNQLKQLGMKSFAMGKDKLTLPEIVTGIAQDYIRINNSAKHYYENIEFLRSNAELSIVKEAVVRIKPNADSITTGTPTSTSMLSATTYNITPTTNVTSNELLYPTFTIDSPLIQKSVSDFTFLQQLADTYGCHFWIDDKGVLYFISHDYLSVIPAGQNPKGEAVPTVDIWYHRHGYPLTKNIYRYPYEIGTPFKDRLRHIPALSLDFSIDSTEFVGGLFGELVTETGQRQPHTDKNTSKLPHGAEQMIPHELSGAAVSNQYSVNPATPKYPQLKCTIIGEPFVYIGMIATIHNVIRSGTDAEDSDQSTTIKGFVTDIKHRIGKTFTTDLEFIVLPLAGEVQPPTGA